MEATPTRRRSWWRATSGAAEDRALTRSTLPSVMFPAVAGQPVTTGTALQQADVWALANAGATLPLHLFERRGDGGRVRFHGPPARYSSDRRRASTRRRSSAPRSRTWRRTATRSSLKTATCCAAAFRLGTGEASLLGLQEYLPRDVTIDPARGFIRSSPMVVEVLAGTGLLRRTGVAQPGSWRLVPEDSDQPKVGVHQVTHGVDYRHVRIST
jgi:hypothetical protein